MRPVRKNNNNRSCSSQGREISGSRHAAASRHVSTRDFLICRTDRFWPGELDLKMDDGRGKEFAPQRCRDAMFAQTLDLWASELMSHLVIAMIWQRARSRTKPLPQLGRGEYLLEYAHTDRNTSINPDSVWCDMVRKILFLWASSKTEPTNPRETPLCWRKRRSPKDNAVNS